MNILPQVTRITKQKRNNQRYNVFLKQGDKEIYGFSVEENTLIEEMIRKGQELDQPTIDALLSKDTIHKAYSLALIYLGHRMRSVFEMKQYLMKKEIDPEHIEEIISRLLKEKLLDDEAFALAFVRTKVNTTVKGPLLIKKELQEKGVHESVAETALATFSREDQLEKINKWLVKEAKKTNRQSHQQKIMKQKQGLMQKGFSHAVITEALEQFKQVKDNQEEWAAVITQGQKILRKQSRKWQGYELKQKVKASLYQKGFGIEEIDRFIQEYLEE